MQQPPPEEEQSFIREPCPWRILDDCGAAFAMGAIGGAVWHGVKGYRNGPRGFKVREMSNAIKLRAPTVGGNFAVWGAMFSTFDCSLAGIRGKEDPWNAIASGFLTSGMLSVRFGPAKAFTAAMGGGFILAMIEGLTMALNKFQGDMAKPQLPQMPDDMLSTPPPPPAAPTPNRAY